MEIGDALRSTGSIREFTKEAVDDSVVFDILNDARYAPSGGNRQAWRVIVVKDTGQREAVAACYLDAWHDYVAHSLIGLVAFSPLASEVERRRAASQRDAAIARSKPDGFAETLASIPVMLVVVADLGALAATDRDLDRYHVAGGASIYPFVWSILLAAHDRNLGGVMTTVATRKEPALKQIFNLPDNYLVASVVALGHPEKRHTKLTRREVSEFTSVDRFDGPPFER